MYLYRDIILFSPAPVKYNRTYIQPKMLIFYKTK